MTLALEIKRSELRQGASGKDRRGTGDAAMRNREGYKCCLGCAYSILGVPDDLLTNKGMPASVLCDSPHLWDQIPDLQRFAIRKTYEEAFHMPRNAEDGDPEYIFSNNQFSASAADTNDDCELTHEEREDELIELFKANDIDLTFVD